jgi:glycosyltransferase involved in cell wall biosynthesis
LAFFDSNPYCDLCFADDGSTDNTLRILQELRNGREDRILVHHLTQNSGKAEAIRQSMFQCLQWKAFDYIGYFDADMATPLQELKHFMAFSGGELEHAMILGSRIKRMGADIIRNEMRHYIGRIFSTFASMILGQPVYDTQCGAKLIRRDLVMDIFAEPFMTRWLFDVEIIARMNRSFGRERTHGMLLEVPLRNWTEKEETRLTLVDFLKVPWELVRIWSRYRK